MVGATLLRTSAAKVRALACKAFCDSVSWKSIAMGSDLSCGGLGNGQPIVGSRTASVSPERASPIDDLRKGTGLSRRRSCLLQKEPMARECPWFWRGLCVFLPQVTWVQSCACLSGENCTGMTHSHSRRAQRRPNRKCRARVPASPSTDDLPLRARPVDDLCNRRNT